MLDDNSGYYSVAPRGSNRYAARWWKSIAIVVALLPTTYELARGQAIQQAEPNPQVTLSSPTLASAPPGPKPFCEQLDSLLYKGLETPPFPTTCDTLDADAAFRKTLFKYGFRTGLSAPWLFEYDLLGHNTNNPRYIGQDLYYHGAEFFELVYDAARLGLPAGSQIAFSPYFLHDNYRGGGPTAFTIPELVAYVPLFHDYLDVQVGYLQWLQAFYGTNLGTSAAASALGPTSSLPTELGLATFPSTPGIAIKAWAPGHHLYNNFGVSRSAAPNSGFDYDTGRGPGPEFVVPGTGAVFVDEIGYLVKRSADEHFLWIRGGAIYNNSEFINYDQRDKRTRGNQGFYLTGDYQITHPSRKDYARGLYVNFKLDATTPDRNIFSDDASISLYGIGLLAARPSDSVSLGITFNRLSHTAEDSFLSATNRSVPYLSTTMIASYVFHVTQGLYFSLPLSWVTEPAVQVRSPRNAFEMAPRLTFIL